MRSRRKIDWIRWLVFGILARTAFGIGHDAGNGGHSVVCSDASGKLASVQLFDLWYARKEVQSALLVSSKDEKELAREVVLKLYRADSRYFDGLMASFANVSQAQVVLGQELQLIPPSTFLGNILPATDQGCEIRPLAVYTDTEVLLTDGKLWEFLHRTENPVARNVQAAAFLVHESLGDMLRREALARLSAGTTLDVETRKQIARDTVNIVAIAFTKQSDKRLQHRLEQYFQNGIVFEKPRIVRIDTMAKVWGKCEDWKTKQLARLNPLSEFALIDCLEEGAQIKAVPKRAAMRFTDNIHSTLFAYSKILDDELGGGEPEAFQSWHARADEWSRAIEKRFGTKLYFHHVGPSVQREVIDRVWHWRAWHGIGGEWHAGYTGIDSEARESGGATSLYYDHRKVGNLDSSIGEVYLFIDTADVRTETESIAGSQYQFYGPENEATEREAARLALASYDEACTAWKEAKYRAGAVFASCSEGAPSYEVDAPQSLSRFTSTGNAIFNDD